MGPSMSQPHCEIVNSTNNSSSTLASNGSPIEKPRNGIAGLKHWKHDIVAGFVVALISLPFSLGIAVASGAPPITGITSAIIAGFVLPLFGGSYVTISGPAAGLAPALMAGMLTLGHGNLATGYPLLLVAIFFAGILQILLYRFKMARYSAIFPAPVVEGMLCAIGLMIIVKQIPLIEGTTFHEKDVFGILREFPSQLPTILDHPLVIELGLFSLVMIFGLSMIQSPVLKVVPPLVFVVVIGSALAWFLGLESKYLVQIPENPLSHGIVTPDFKTIFQDSSLWLSCATLVLTLTMIDGVESLATIAAIDKIDPYKRRSNPDRTLLAIGVSKIVSSLAGGLTIIPGGVKSTANIMAGGKTQWASFYNACFLLGMLLFLRDIINLFPYPVLAAVLIFTGYKLCKPSIWIHMYKIGPEQLVVFSVTAVVTICTDLLVGIFAGIFAKCLVTAWNVVSIERQLQSNRSWLVSISSLFQDPVSKVELQDRIFHVYAEGPLCCFNVLAFSRALESVPAEANTIRLHFGEGVRLIDHTTRENLLSWIDESHVVGIHPIELVGWGRMAPRTMHISSMCVLDTEHILAAGMD